MILGQVDVTGTYTLASTRANELAIAAPGATHTAFTGELLHLLRDGVPDGPDLLTFGLLFPLLHRAMSRNGLPLPDQRNTGTISGLALTRNPTATPEPEPEPEPEVTGKRSARYQRILSAAGVAVAVLVVLGVAFWRFGPIDGFPSGSPSPSSASNAQAAARQEPDITAGTDFLTQLKVTTLYTGSGPVIRTGQTVTVRYALAYYRTGAIIESSWQSGEQFEFLIGAGELIKGWDRGLIGVAVGSRVQLDIPADLAYGESPENGRPRGPLRAVVDVIAVK